MPGGSRPVVYLHSLCAQGGHASRSFRDEGEPENERSGVGDARGDGVQRWDVVTTAMRKVIAEEVTAHHMYFSYDEKVDVIAVRAVWHAARGVGPALR